VDAAGYIRKRGYAALTSAGVREALQATPGNMVGGRALSISPACVPPADDLARSTIGP
jgi:hypothetical protein